VSDSYTSIAFPRIRRTPLALAVALALTTVSDANPVAPTVSANSFEGRATAAHETLRLQLSVPVETIVGRYALFLGAKDITAMLSVTGDTVAYSAPSGLPAGRSDVVLQFYDGNVWRESARVTLQVGEEAADGALTASPGSLHQPAPSSTLPWKASPRATLTSAVGGQHASTSTADRATSHINSVTGGFQGGFALEASGSEFGGWAVKLNADAAGSSVRSQALRFAQLAADAPKLDLSSYLFEASAGPMQLALGHVNVGSHPLLMNALAFRGISVRYALGAGADVVLTTQNGSAIVGYDRLFGLYDANHRFIGATLGYELFQQEPGRLRAELAFIDASTSEQRPDVTLVPQRPSQESHGFGLRLLGRTQDARGTFDVAWARSQYRGTGAGLFAPLAETTRDAYTLEGKYQLLTPGAGTWPVAATLGLKHEYADPLYKSLGAGYGSDFRATAVSLNASLGVITAQLSANARQDNVAGNRATLTNRLESLQLNLSAPLAQLVGASTATLWPTANVTLSRNRQWGARAPSALEVTAIPNSVTDAFSVGLGWQGGRWSLSANLGTNTQDNRQVGSETRDVRTLTYGVQSGWRVTDDLTVNAGISPNRSTQSFDGLQRTAWNPNFGIQWNTPWGAQLSSQVNFDRSNDNQTINGTRNWGINNQLTKSFKVPSFSGGTHSVQLSLRHFLTYAHNRTAFGVVDQQTTSRTHGFMLNVSLPLF
jgi:hypothetical protein